MGQGGCAKASGQIPVSPDFDEGERHYRLEPSDELTPDQIFLRNWGRALLDKVFQQLRSEFEADGKAHQIARTVVALSSKHNIWKAALSGGVFQNELLGKLVREAIIRDSRIELFTNRDVPVNDGGICLGQAAAAWARYRVH